jgi:uncharacterized protein YegP (UPF0339 family)
MYEIQVVRKVVFWYVRLVSCSNGEILLTSEIYYSHSNAKRAAHNLAKNLNIQYKELE